MERLVARVAVFLVALAAALAVPAAGQTPVPLPITGNLGQIAGTPQAYAGVYIQLQNCPTPASVTGYMGIVATTYQLMANSAGAVNGSVWPNDLITCNGTTGASQYALRFVVNGVPSGTVQCYQVVSTQGVWSLNGQQQPIACSQTPPNPQDGFFRNLTVTGFLQGNNFDFTGGGTIHGALTLGGLLTLFAAPGTCPTGQYIDGLSATLTIHCSPLSGIVTSFNGRTGAVVPATGDYSYGQISGTPTIYYQTVQGNGSSLPQQPLLNFDATMCAANGSGVTTAGLCSVGTAGLHPAPSSFTTDAYGRVTAVGAAAPQVLASISFSTSANPLAANGGQWVASAFAAWGKTLPNNTYQLNCSFQNDLTGAVNSGTISFTYASKTTTGFTWVLNGDHSGSLGFTTTMDCVATE